MDGNGYYGLCCYVVLLVFCDVVDDFVLLCMSDLWMVFDLVCWFLWFMVFVVIDSVVYFVLVDLVEVVCELECFVGYCGVV